MKKLLVIAFIGLMAFGIYDAFEQNRVIGHPPGVLAAVDPIQHNLNNAKAFLHNGYSITPLANFVIEARVLSREKYKYDRAAELSPVDFALGWGPMSDTSVIEKLDIRQSVRYFSWRVDDIRDLPLPVKEISVHSANMHMIPADSLVEKKLAAVREGHIVAISGQLVKVKGVDGFIWGSSMTRTDTGNGACEIIYVRDVQIL